MRSADPSSPAVSATYPASRINPRHRATKPQIASRRAALPHHPGHLSTARRLSCEDVAELLADRMEELVQELAGEPTNRGREEWRFRRKGSLAVCVAGPKCGSWFDHEAGEGGDALGLVAHLHGVAMGAAFHWALDWLGLPAASMPRPAPLVRQRPAPAPRTNSASDTLDLARALWREAQPAGEVVTAYLSSRGLRPEPAAPIRFHPMAWRSPAYGPRGPAMLALMTSAATAEPCGLHVTYLRPDGSGKAEGERPKIMLGRAGVIRLSPQSTVADRLGIAEGIETGLSVMQGFGWRPVWAAGSAGSIRSFPVLPDLSLTIFADTGEAGATAAEECASRWSRAGQPAAIYTPPRGDFNDVLREMQAQEQAHCDVTGGAPIAAQPRPTYVPGDPDELRDGLLRGFYAHRQENAS